MSRRVHWSLMSPANNTSCHDMYTGRCCHLPWSLMSPANNTSNLPVVIQLSCLFRVTSAPHLTVGPSPLWALRYGMRCLMTSEIWRWDATHFNVSSRQFCSRSNSFPRALEVFHDYALYKFTTDIDIDTMALCHLTAILHSHQCIHTIQQACKVIPCHIITSRCLVLNSNNVNLTLENIQHSNNEQTHRKHNATLQTSR